MRKVISILLIAILFINLSGYYLFYQFRLWEVKTAMKESLRHNRNSHDVVCFKLSATQQPSIAWENENEFRLGNEMYDVLEKFTEGDQLVIRCIADKKENFLVQQFRAKNNDETPASKSSKLALIKVMTHFFEPVGQIQITAAIPQKIIHNTVYSSYTRTIHLPVVLPPPQVA